MYEYDTIFVSICISPAAIRWANIMIIRHFAGADTRGRARDNSSEMIMTNMFSIRQ